VKSDKRLWWKHIAAVQIINEVRFMKMRVARKFLKRATQPPQYIFSRPCMLYQILQMSYFFFNFNRTNLSVCFLILHRNMRCMPHFSWKHRKLIGQNKVKICKSLNQNFTFLGQKIGCPTYNTWSDATRLEAVIGLTTSPRHALMNCKKTQMRTLLWKPTQYARTAESA